jgi:2-hydroxy-3-oxopropionate reductase
VNVGATSANSPKEIAEQAEVIVTMLPASAHVMEVYTGKDGILRYLISIGEKQCVIYAL